MSNGDLLACAAPQESTEWPSWNPWSSCVDETAGQAASCRTAWHRACRASSICKMQDLTDTTSSLIASILSPAAHLILGSQ